MSAILAAMLTGGAVGAATFNPLAGLLGGLAALFALMTVAPE